VTDTGIRKIAYSCILERAKEDTKRIVRNCSLRGATTFGVLGAFVPYALTGEPIAAVIGLPFAMIGTLFGVYVGIGSAYYQIFPSLPEELKCEFKEHIYLLLK
jgi:hypothetical protein